jgi:phosphoribosylaminoimidazolecarboxamide formyltransferase/IMP cyclohydrolase
MLIKETQPSRWRALFSTYDKEGIVPLAKFLVEHNWEIFATQGTTAFLNENGCAAKPVEELNGIPIALGGRVKTLDVRILGGLLWDKNNTKYNADAEKLQLQHFDLLVSSFYPFATVAKNANTYNDVVEFIDVGGPSMLRAAAKNHLSVIPLVQKGDYQKVINELHKENGSPKGLTTATRHYLALQAFKHLIDYDKAIAGFMQKITNGVGV